MIKSKGFIQISGLGIYEPEKAVQSSEILRELRVKERLINTVDWFLSETRSSLDIQRLIDSRSDSLYQNNLDRPSYRHGILLARYGDILLGQLNVPKIKEICVGIALHDVGKMVVNPEVLLKPSQLSFDERKQMEKHAQAGYELIKSRPNTEEDVAQTALFHHERFDGRGYPLGLSGEKIPLGARVASVIDVFDALLTERPYKPAWDLEAVVDFLKIERGRRFDVDITDVLVGNVDNLFALHQAHINELD